MLKRFGAHVSRYVVPYLLLFALLGGTAYAASKVKSDDLGKTRVRQSDANVANGQAVTHTTECRSGERALGGGVKWRGDPTSGKLAVVQAFLSPVKNPDKYTVTGAVNSGGSRTLVVEAYCLTD